MARAAGCCSADAIALVLVSLVAARRPRRATRADGRRRAGLAIAARSACTGVAAPLVRASRRAAASAALAPDRRCCRCVWELVVLRRRLRAGRLRRGRPRARRARLGVANLRRLRPRLAAVRRDGVRCWAAAVLVRVGGCSPPGSLRRGALLPDWRGRRPRRRRRARRRSGDRRRPHGRAVRDDDPTVTPVPTPARPGRLRRAYAGGPERHREKATSRASCPCASASRGCSTTARSPRTRCSPTGRPTARRRRRRHRHGHDRRPHGRADGQRPDVKAGSWGRRRSRRSCASRRPRSRTACRWSTSSTRRARASPTRSQMFPGRRHAGRIFFNEVRLSGAVPQVCVLFGPSAAGGAYIPAFCDVVIMRDGNASMYLGSPRMAEMVIGEKVSLEEMGGAKMHTGVSGCGHFLVKSDEEGIDLAKRYLSYFPSQLRARSRRPRRRAAAAGATPIRELDPRGREQAVGHARADRRARRRGLVPRGPQALGEGADRRLRAARRPRRSASSPTSRSSRAACCSSTRPTRPRASSGPATRSASRCCSSPTCPAS